jgi:hypothetical protein
MVTVRRQQVEWSGEPVAKGDGVSTAERLTQDVKPATQGHEIGLGIAVACI